MSQDVNIFDLVPNRSWNFFRFQKIGDRVQGTYIKRDDSCVDGYGKEQTVVDLLQPDGTILNVGISKNKTGLLEALDKVTIGQIIGFMFEGTKENVGKQPTKYIRLIQDPNVKNEEWLKEQEAKNNPTANMTVDQIFASPTAELPVTTAPAAPLNVTPVSDSEKIAQIAQIAKTKLGALTAADVKTKIVEKTGLDFISANLDAILEQIKAL